MLLGAHESIAGGVCNAIYLGQQATCDAVQLFTRPSQQWQAPPLSDEDVARFRAAVAGTGIVAACAHSSYLINLGSPDRGLQAGSRAALADEMERCERLGIPRLVLHPGAHVGSGEKVGLRRIARNIDRVLGRLADGSVSLCLETTSGAGSHLGHTFEQLAMIIGRVERPDRIGVCLDTCHVFAAGYPLAEPEAYERTIEQFDQAIGLERLAVIHLNDSQTPLGSRRDRHAHIGAGELGLKAFRLLLNDPRLRHVPMVLETPKGDGIEADVANLKRLRRLIRRPAPPGRRRRR